LKHTSSKKIQWPKFGRIGLSAESRYGEGAALYAFAIACLALEAFFTFASPVIVQLTIDSVYRDEAAARALHPSRRGGMAARAGSFGRRSPRAECRGSDGRGGG
jgi:hypothetical protein